MTSPIAPRRAASKHSPGSATAPQPANHPGPEAAPAADADQALARHRDALRERFPLPAEARQARTPRRRRAAPLVAAVAVAAVAALVGIDPAWRTEYLATGPQQRLEVTLHDGSQATLDVSTRLTVSRHLRSRRVALAAGRSLFDVQPSAWRPFTVDAGATGVRVLGTAFDVRRLGDDVTVTVLRGRVAVQGTNGAHATLGPEEQVRTHAGALHPVTSARSADATAWREGRMVFQHTPLAEVAAEIARYSGRPVRLADASLAELEVSGVYRTANADALLALLPSFLPLRVEAGHGGERVLRALPPR